MKHTKKALVALVMAVLMVAMTACSASKFDASSYVKSCLDVLTKGEKDKYMELTGRTEEEATQDYEDNLQAMVDDMASIGITDESLLEQYRTFFADLMKLTKYDVKEAKEDGDNYTVDVEITPVTGVFDGIMDQLLSDAEEYGAEKAAAGEEVTDEELQQWVCEKLLELVKANMASATYGEPTTVTVHVVDNDDVYEIPEADYTALDDALIDLGDLAE